MSRFEPSLLDKLFGDGRNQPAPAVVRQLSLDELKGTVARHIESLLNARITFTDERLAGFDEWVEKAGDASGLRDRLVVTTANTVVNILAKGAKGAATAYVTMRLALHAGVRIQAANITPLEMQKWILDQGKALGLKLEGNRVQRRATAAKISQAVLLSF